LFATVALQWRLWGWEVEDSAISFAYARSWAMGDGLLAQPGVERVEGFSNPLWVGILTLGYLAGLDPFGFTRWLGMLLGVGTVLAVYVAVRPLQKQLPLAPLAAAATAAVFAPNVIWAQSGLENSLFSFLLAAGCARVAVGGRGDVLGPFLFLLLALTRPEGIAYGLVAGCAVIATSSSWHAVAVRGTTWLLMLGVPFLASEGLRLWYFGQELPATFHAKLGNEQVDVLDAAGRGWRQLVSFAYETGSLVLVPLAVVGASGAIDWRWVTGLVSLGMLLLAWLMGPTLPVLALLLALPVLAFGRKLPIGLASSLLLVAVAFHLGTGGDWMRGYRWMSLVTVPGAMLVGVGIAELVERFDPIWIGRMRLPALLPFGICGGIALLPQIVYTWTYSALPETTPASVEQRLDHFLEVAARLQMDRRPRIVDHDMGGMLWFGGSLAWIRDARGLVDLPFALYGNEPAIVEHELFGERPFDFAHAHAATGVALRRIPAFRAQYIEIEPYGRGSRLHGGQFVARSLLLEPSWTGPQIPVEFAGGAALAGVEVPSPEVGPGSGVYLEVGLRRGKGRGVRLVAFLTDGRRVGVSWELPPAYDWVPVSKWREGEVFHGRFSLPIPENLPQGSYDLGLLVLDSSGVVLGAKKVGAGAVLPQVPVYARGEVRFPGLVKVVSREEMNRMALSDLSSAFHRANKRECEEAEHFWELALRHRTRSRDWRASNRPPVARAIATCWAERASVRSQEGEALLERVREIERARDWDPRERAVWVEAVGIASEAHERAVAAQDPVLRFRWAEAAVRADPRRSWDRRLAERARRTWMSMSRSPDAEGAEREEESEP
jgi:hypothetical protein